MEMESPEPLQEKKKKKKRKREKDKGEDNPSYAGDEYAMAEIPHPTAPPVGYQPPPEVILQPVPVRKVAAPQHQHQHPQTSYMALQPGGMPYSKPTAVKPKQPSQPYDYLCYNIFLTVFCCFLTGIFGIYFSLRTRSLNRRNSYQNARSSSNLAFLFAMMSIGIGMFIFFVIIIACAIVFGRG